MSSEKPAGANPAARPTLLQSLATFGERRTLVMLVLGFSAGLPNLLIFDTLSIWLREAGLSLAVIGIFSLATLASAMKFLWAPLVDRTTVPILTKWLGHRRSWMLVSQAVIMLGLWLIAGVDPATNLGVMALFAVLVGFASANQDIVIDAWRIEVADDDRQGPMAAAYQWGYRIAMIVAGAVPLVLATAFGWHLSYAVMAALMILGVLAVLAAPREEAHEVRPIPVGDMKPQPAREALEWAVRGAILLSGALLLGSGLAGSADFLAGLLRSVGAGGLGDVMIAAWASDAKVWFQLAAVLAGFVVIALAAQRIPRLETRPGAYLSGALGQPLVDFFQRYGKAASLILALICLYRISDFVLNINGAFYIDLGFSKIEIAEVRKVFGMIMSVIGVAVGGLSVIRLGLMRSLVIGAFAGPLSNLVFAWLATQGHDLGALFIAIGVDNISGGYAGTCLIAYMSSLTAVGFTATQYALFSSLYALPGKLLASQSGRIVESAAHAAEGAGPISALKGLFAGLPPETYAEAMTRSQVTPAALGSGYLVFYLYSTVIGVFAILLAFMIIRQKPAPDQDVARQTT
ncbi:MAG: MFS transporter [Caulobacter sp.]|nr:MFS transporter [Caulobacter sp.]